MVESRDKTPNAQETFLQMAQAAGLRGRLLVTIGLLALIRLGIHIPVPGINHVAYQEATKNNSLLGFLDIFSGGGVSTVGIFALGILPYINASIIIQLLTAALPYLENLQKNEGEAGRRKIAQITRFVSLGWSIIQSVGIATYLQNFALTKGFNFTFQTALALITGSMFVMWVSELITERGVGNGASLLIFINITATLPKSLNQTVQLVETGGVEISRIIILLFVFLIMIVSIVFVQEGIRRIPIIYARRQISSTRVQRERTSYLPLRLIQGGVMPLIFASAVVFLPNTLAGITNTSNNPVIAAIHEGTKFVSDAIKPDGQTPWVYPIVNMLLIMFFSYFYASLTINPVDLAQNLKKMGASIPGIRPGKTTSEYVEGVLNRLTFLGAVFLGLVAIVPTAIESAIGVQTFRGMGATSLLILVSVAIETAKQIQTYVISQRYEGMVKQ